MQLAIYVAIAVFLLFARFLSKSWLNQESLRCYFDVSGWNKSFWDLALPSYIHLIPWLWEFLYRAKKPSLRGLDCAKKSAISNIFLTNCKSQSKEPFVKEVLQRGCLLHQAASSACHTRLYWRNINPPCKSRCAHGHKIFKTSFNFDLN